MQSHKKLNFACLLYVFLQNAHFNQLSSKGGRRWIPCHLWTVTLMTSDYEPCPTQLPGFGMKSILLVVLPTGTTTCTGPGRTLECYWHSCPPECALLCPWQSCCTFVQANASATSTCESPRSSTTESATVDGILLWVSKGKLLPYWWVLFFSTMFKFHFW